jgi:4-amino-4-deoxy-L-arabinose transferase-like glycosyltransferase
MMTLEKAHPAKQKFSWLFQTPPLWLEVLLWLGLFAATAGIRLYLAQLLPVALWSRDANSYAASAFQWLQTGVWETDPRRGAVYSLFIAGCIKLFGDIHGIMTVQHILGGLAVMIAVFCSRILLGRKALIPWALCSFAYAVYGFPIRLEHIVRNETLLLFCATLTFASWLMAIRQEKAAWLWITGVSVAVLLIIKQVYTPFPLLLISGCLYFYRKTPRAALKYVAIFLTAFLLPTVGNVAFKKATMIRPPEPQDGILFYGRTAQFTFLEGGKHAEVKELIRQDILDYRKLPKLDNNVILKITAVPRLRDYLSKQGKDGRDLNRLCWELGLEGIKANPGAYAKQVLKDLYTLHFLSVKGAQTLDTSDLKAGAKLISEGLIPDAFIHAEASLDKFETASQRGHLSTYNRWVHSSWLFLLAPSFLTTLLLPLMVYQTRGSPIQMWWLAALGVWLFTMVLLSTIGRPIDRYLLPVLPIIFWTLTSSFALLWEMLAARLGGTSSAPKSNP